MKLILVVSLVKILNILLWVKCISIGTSTITTIRCVSKMTFIIVRAMCIYMGTMILFIRIHKCVLMMM